MNYSIVIPGYIIEVLIIYKYCFSLMEPRYSKWKSVFLYVTISAANNIKALLIFDQVFMRSVTTYIIHILMIHLIFKDKLRKKLAVYVLYAFCVFMGEGVSVVLAFFVYGCSLDTFNEVSVSNYLWQITAYILNFFLSTVVLIMIKKKHINPDNLAVQYISLYAAVQFLIIAMLYAIIVEYGVVSVSMFLIVSGMILISFAVSVVIYRVVKSSLYTKAEAEFLRKESEMKNAHFEKLKNQYMSYRRLRHDVYNHLRIIDEMDDTEKIRVYISDIKKEFDELEDSGD